MSGFWLLDSLKDPVLAGTLGIEYQPTAKLISVAFSLVIVCIYDFITTISTRKALFYIVSGVYGTVFVIIAGILANPITGLKNETISNKRIIGYISYVCIESYGSMMVALFWSFTNSVMKLEEAKGAYGLIITMAQLGAIAGATVASLSTYIPISQSYLIGAISVLCISLIAKSYNIIFPVNIIQIDIPDESSHDPPIASSNIFHGLYQGIVLIFRYRYVMLLLGVSSLFEVALTILDFEFKVRGQSFSSTAISLSDINSSIMLSDGERFTQLLGWFGQTTNFISLIISCFGFSFIVQKIGVRYTLLIFPSLLFVSVIITNLSANVWISFVLVSVLKGLTYSVNDPAKELLYIPTSDAIKYRAKAWIDVFGARLAKAIGSTITQSSHGDLRRLKDLSQFPCIVLSATCILLAWRIGEEFEKLVLHGLVVGADVVLSTRGNHASKALPMINGLLPGDVGYEGYDPDLFEGVFDDDDDRKSAYEANEEQKVYGGNTKLLLAAK